MPRDFNLRMYQDELANLSKDELMALALAQAAQIAELTRRITELEGRLGPPKTPDNSSVPPAQGRKANRAARRVAKKRKGRPRVFRALAANPDRIVETLAEHCPHCEHALGPQDQPGYHAYDHIELPPIRPVVTRIHLYPCQPKSARSSPQTHKMCSQSAPLRPLPWAPPHHR
jgi:transposase